MPLARPLLLGLLCQAHLVAPRGVEHLSTFWIEAPVQPLHLISGPQCPPVLTSCP